MSRRILGAYLNGGGGVVVAAPFTFAAATINVAYSLIRFPRPPASNTLIRWGKGEQGSSESWNVVADVVVVVVVAL